MNVSIAFVIAFQGFRDEELFVPLKHFLASGYSVDVYSTQKGKALGKLGGEYQVKHVLKELEIDNYEVLVIAGGPGGYGYIGDVVLLNIINKAYQSSKIIAAICMATQLVAETGILKGVRATIYSGDKDKLTQYGALYTAKSVEQDGLFITADGPSSSQAFAEAIVTQMSFGRG